MEEIYRLSSLTIIVHGELNDDTIIDVHEGGLCMAKGVALLNVTKGSKKLPNFLRSDSWTV